MQCNAMRYIILIFDSTHRVLLAEKVLLKQAVKFDIIQTPKEISSSCGMSVRLDPELTDPVKAITLLKAHKIECMVFEKDRK
ncbi:MAG: DUF3343 domain-containing protein [Bacteroidales bacterium]|nr:DUF3343 domain-containing protein [Bacteroidales bacterium]